jgi:outer membrane receptor for ferrienterochelin and colicin
LSTVARERGLEIAVSTTIVSSFNTFQVMVEPFEAENRKGTYRHQINELIEHQLNLITAWRLSIVMFMWTRVSGRATQTTEGYLCALALKHQ